MINAANFVYSKAAAARILGIKVFVIARFEIWHKVCFVHVRGQRPTFMSKKAFKQHFVDWRIQQGRLMCVSQVNQEHFRVINPRNSNAYSVFVYADSFDCECHDYQNQITIFGGDKACCKHAYGVLTWLGFNRLSDYIEAKQKAIALS